MTHHIDLTKIHLISGSGRGDELCVMQWVARFAGEEVTDHPACTSPVLTAFAITWNDGLPEDERQRLIPFIPRLVGTAGDPEADAVRAWMATDWLVRTFTVTWLRKAGLVARADELAALPALTSADLAAAAQPIIEKARAEADAARAAAWDAARAAAWDAAGDAAWDAAGDAAGDAARAAAWDAARDAAGVAARDAAWDAAKGKKTYQAQYNAAYAAARPLVGAALGETIVELRESAFELFSAMIDVRAA
jgi:hypothetical protein